MVFVCLVCKKWVSEEGHDCLNNVMLGNVWQDVSKELPEENFDVYISD